MSSFLSGDTFEEEDEPAFIPIIHKPADGSGDGLANRAQVADSNTPIQSTQTTDNSLSLRSSRPVEIGGRSSGAESSYQPSAIRLPSVSSMLASEALGQVPIISGQNAHHANPQRNFATAAMFQPLNRRQDTPTDQCNPSSKRKLAQAIDLTVSDDSSDETRIAKPTEEIAISSGSESDIQITKTTLPKAPEIQYVETHLLLGQIRSIVLVLTPVPCTCYRQARLSVGEDPDVAGLAPPLGISLRREDRRGRVVPSKPDAEVVWAVSNETGEQFGCLDSKVAEVLGPVMGGKPFAEGRVRLQSAVLRVPTEGKPAVMEVLILVFSIPRLSTALSDHLYKHGIILTAPSLAYNGPEPYRNPHELVQRADPIEQARERMMNRLAGLHSPSTSWNSGTSSIKTAQTTEAQKREQIEQVFATMRSGVDLDIVEPDPIVTTKLYPHQKQALSFLLDREQLRLLPPKKAPEEESYIGLWRLHESTSGPSYWVNEVTGITVAFSRLRPTMPPQPRGAILADDMGLGKTAVVISLIANTRQEARTFSDLKVASWVPTGASTFDANKIHPITKKQPLSFSAFETLLPFGAPPAKPSAKKKKAGKRELQKEETEARRIRRLLRRSRATLIICPLSTIANWETQVHDHTNTNADDPFTVYVYHGPTRTSDPDKLCDYDIVLTTFATLGTEYSKMCRAEDPDSSSSDSDIQGVDSAGTAIDAPKGKRKKRRRKAGDGGSSPLQQIEWFRVVLDEAHMIKEHSTIQARAACELSADRRICLTGTPLQNSLNDLFSLMRFLRVEPFTDRGIWNHYIGSPAKSADALAVSRLQLLARHTSLRRTKETRTPTGELILSLPPKHEDLVFLELDEHEKAFYSSHHKQYKSEFMRLEQTDSVGKNYASILQELLRLRQICVHLALVRDSEDASLPGSDPVAAIGKHGVSKSRALSLLSILREAGPIQCGVCTIKLADGLDGNEVEQAGDVDEKPKKGRKAKAETDRELPRELPIEAKTIVLTKCLHISCLYCFQKACPQFPSQASANDRTICKLCNIEITPVLEAVVINPGEVQDSTDVKAADDDDLIDDGKVRAPTTRSVEHSTKIKQLMHDLFPFSQANPASRNYQPDFGIDPSQHDMCAVEDLDKPRRGDAVKSIIFSQWTKLLDRVGDALDQLQITFARLDGSMSREARSAAMETFKREPSCEVLLVSLRAGGVGLNLTAGSRVYLMEPFWNPAVEHQAVDRTHRLGQTRAVKVVRYIIKDSIEQNMLEIQKRKMDLANLSMSQTLSKAQLAERRVQDLKILFR